MLGGKDEGKEERGREVRKDKEEEKEEEEEERNACLTRGFLGDKHERENLGEASHGVSKLCEVC